MQEVAKPPAGVFTNHIATDGATGYSVLLFDNLNIDSGQDVFTYTARAKNGPPGAHGHSSGGDRITMYALSCQFRVMREVTSDRDSLIRAA